MLTPEIVDHVLNLVLARRIAETLEISRKCVGCIIHEHLGMKKLSAKEGTKMFEYLPGRILFEQLS